VLQEEIIFEERLNERRKGDHTNKMPRKDILRYRIKDIGRPKHHYLQIEVRKKIGKRGGRTVGKLITYSELVRRIKHARKKKKF
jgi:hypothetical protein